MQKNIINLIINNIYARIYVGHKEIHQITKSDYFYGGIKRTIFISYSLTFFYNMYFCKLKKSKDF